MREVHYHARMESNGISHAAMPAGINVEPGMHDDGWMSPPPVPLADGSIIQLYKDGEALKAGYRAIEQATSRICLESYIFASDPTGLAFAELLSKKAREGVNVYVIYDSFGSLASDRSMFRQMHSAGVKLQEFHPVRPWETRFSWRPFNRDHRKLLLVDNEIAGMGGLNVAAEYAGSWIIHKRDANTADFWRDTAIGIRGPSARQFLRCFAKTWHYGSHGGRIRGAEFSYGLESLDIFSAEPHLSVLGSVPTVSSPLRSVLFKLFRGAQKSIEMTMAYFAPDDDLINALCRAAKRGVRVRLMLPARTDVQLLMIAARSFYEKLMSAGVEIYERQVAVLHAKTMCIDQRVSMIGSTNLDYRSIEYNLELSSIVHSEMLGRQMHDLFNNDVAFAKRISLQQWRRRPNIDRFVQWVVSRARYLL